MLLFVLGTSWLRATVCALLLTVVVSRNALALDTNAGFVDLPWQQPCDKHRLCRTLVQQHVLAVVLCARNPACNVPESVDCFAGQAYMLPYRCSAAECIEVASFAESTAECNAWFPRMTLPSKRWMRLAIDNIRSGANSPNISLPVAAARADFKSVSKKGKGGV